MIEIRIDTRGERSTAVVRPRLYEAVLFDLDGVLTPTAALHARCWKQTFDPVLAEWADPPAPRRSRLTPSATT